MRSVTLLSPPPPSSSSSFLSVSFTWLLIFCPQFTTGLVARFRPLFPEGLVFLSPWPKCERRDSGRKTREKTTGVFVCQLTDSHILADNVHVMIASLKQTVNRRWEVWVVMWKVCVECFPGIMHTNTHSCMHTCKHTYIHTNKQTNKTLELVEFLSANLTSAKLLSCYSEW